MAYNYSKGEQASGDIRSEDDPDTKVDFGSDRINLVVGGSAKLATYSQGVLLDGMMGIGEANSIPTPISNCGQVFALDAGDKDTALLFKFEGSEAYLTDYSKFATNAWLMGSSATTSTSVYKWGSRSLRLQQSNASYGDYDRVSVPHTYFNPRYESFTVECWLYATSNPGSGDVATIATQANEDSNWAFVLSSSGRLAIGIAGGSTWLATSGTITLNQWCHVAAVHDINWSNNTFTTSIYIDGTQSATSAESGTTSYWSSTENPLVIGYMNDGSDHSPLEGYIDDFRVSTTARYSGSSFSVPTSSLGGTTAMFAQSANGEMRRIS
tara:strand:+ start:72680 stop:73654 length:975 start_codon:yes stop_codon:yes gene_type:complete